MRRAPGRTARAQRRPRARVAQVVPGYGGGMSSAKAALESDTRVLAWEVGRKYGLRVNTISAGPLKSRAASAIKKKEEGKKSFIEIIIDYAEANAPLAKNLYADDVGSVAACLCSPLCGAITGKRGRRAEIRAERHGAEMSRAVMWVRIHCARITGAPHTW